LNLHQERSFIFTPKTIIVAKSPTFSLGQLAPVCEEKGAWTEEDDME